MIQIRNLELVDLLGLERLFEQKKPEYPIPDVMNRLYVSKKAIIVDEQYVGSAFAWVTTETSLILDDNLSKITKAKIIHLLFKILLNELKAEGYEDTHVFVLPASDEKYAEFLTKHLGFVRATGIPLYKRK